MRNHLSSVYACLVGGLLLAVLSGTVATADDTVPYRQYTAQDGLPHETVLSLAKGPEGRLWIGTRAGPAVYDGHEIQPVDLPDSLQNSAVLDLLVHPSGTVWVALEKTGIVGIRKGRIIRTIRPPSATNSVRRLVAQGDRVLAVTRKALWVIAGGHGSVMTHPYDYPIRTGRPVDPGPRVGYGVVDADRAPNGTLWVLDGRRGLGRLALDGSVTFLDSSFALQRGWRWGDFRVEQSGSAILVGNPGAFRVDLSTGRRTEVDTESYREIYTHSGTVYWVQGDRIVQVGSDGTQIFDSDLGLPDVLYRTVFRDPDFGLWIGTDEGLLHLPTPDVRHTNRLGGSDLRWMTSIGIDSTRRELWAASWGRGLYRVRPRSRHVRPHSEDKWTFEVRSRDGSLHALSRQGWFRRTESGWTLVNESLVAVQGVVNQNGTGFFWANTGLVRVAPSRSATPDTLWHWPREERGYYALALGRGGTLLLRSKGALLQVPPDAPGRADTVTTFPEYAEMGSVEMLRVADTVYIVLNREGIFEIDLGAATPRPDLVLSDDGIERISAAGDSLLLVGTNAGLTVLDTRTRRVRRHLTTADGLASNHAHGAKIYGDTLYVTHDNGLSKLPKGILTDTPEAPTALLTEWSVNDTPRPLRDSTRLSADERTVSFDFTGVHLGRGASVDYAYRLVPYDTTWTTTMQAFTRYTDLPPGRYRFEVRARLADGVVGPPAQMAFTIPKAFHETSWFRLFGIAVIGALIGGAYLWRTRVLRQRQRTLQRLVDRRTERLAQEKQKTEEQAQRLKTLDAEKSRFFANISHELRTPLTILRGTLEDVVDGKVGGVSVAVKEKLEILRSNVHRLHRLTEQLLDLARLETAGSTLNREPRDLIDDLRERARSFVPLAERRGLDLTVETSIEALPCRVDAAKLETVVGNLLSNAIKNTPRGGEVRVHIDVEEGSPPQAIIRVDDSGRGIALDRQAEIFERFTHGREGVSGQEGTGIGLALAREYVELHEGTIDVESTPGTGSTFTVRLPVPPADPETVGARTEGEASKGDVFAADGSTSQSVDRTPGEDGPVVLIVEDNADVRTYLRDHLSEAYQVIEARDGEEGLAVAQDAVPDVILTDLMMPELDGIAFCRRVREDDELGHTPLVLLTARAAEEDAVDALEAGADAYVTKPFSMATLKARIHRLLEAHWAGAPSDAPERHLASDVEATAEEETFLNRVTEVIEENRSRSSFTVDDLAANVGLSTRQLHRKLKRLTDLTPAVFIRRYRLDVALQLLTEGTGTVSEIAYEVGFGTPETFSRHFEERFGRSPSAYVNEASS